MIAVTRNVSHERQSEEAPALYPDRYEADAFSFSQDTAHSLGDYLWGSMVEFITVGRDKEITVTFRDGTEIGR